MLLTKRESAILKVYEMACAALKHERDCGMITDEDYLAGVKRLYGAYIRDIESPDCLV